MGNPLVYLLELLQDIAKLTTDIYEALMNPIALSMTIDLPQWLNDWGVADFNVGALITSALNGMGITTLYNLIFGGGMVIIIGFTLIKFIKVW